MTTRLLFDLENLQLCTILTPKATARNLIICDLDGESSINRKVSGLRSHKPRKSAIKKMTAIKHQNLQDKRTQRYCCVRCIGKSYKKIGSRESKTHQSKDISGIAKEFRGRRSNEKSEDCRQASRKISIYRYFHRHQLSKIHLYVPKKWRQIKANPITPSYREASKSPSSVPLPTLIVAFPLR